MDLPPAGISRFPFNSDDSGIRRVVRIKPLDTFSRLDIQNCVRIPVARRPSGLPMSSADCTARILLVESFPAEPSPAAIQTACMHRFQVHGIAAVLLAERSMAVLRM